MILHITSSSMEKTAKITGSNLVFRLQSLSRRGLSTSSVVSRCVEDQMPKSLASISSDARALVLTESSSPFRIVSVNTSWEKLCGFSQNECRGKTLSCIQGDRTNLAAIRAAMNDVTKGHEVCTVLKNYSKEGTMFQNRLRIGPIRNHQGIVTHYVGLLEEVNELVDRSMHDRYSMHSNMTSVV